MPRQNRKRRKEPKLFPPHAIATRIHEAVTIDLRSREPGSEAASVYRELQIASLLKKFAFGDGDRDELEDQAFRKFLAVNERMGNYVTIAVPQVSRLTSNCSDYDKIMLRARALAHFVLTPLEEDEWYRLCKHGAGSSLGVSYQDTSLERKLTFPITMTRDVVPLWQRFLVHDGSLRTAVQRWNRDNPVTDWKQVVEGSRATTVDKTVNERRMIAVEPTGNMFFQQGLMAALYDRLKAVGLDVERLPPTHQERAMISSITGREATVDWSSASDCVSIGLLRWLLPPQWFDRLDLVRCKTMALQGQSVRLNMFSTMGNADTFPLETLAFWCLAHAVRLTLRPGNSLFPEWDELKSCSVFGDDCIVPSETAYCFLQVCGWFGFVENEDKSFITHEGFRESCGGDYYRGCNVRPYHLRAPTSAKLSALEPWLYVVMNSLRKKYIAYFGELTYVYEKRLWELFAELCAEYQIHVKLVPEHYPDDSGLKITSDLQRWASCYRLTFSRIERDEHGTYRFNYLNFRYRHRTKRSDDLRYADWLRSSSFVDDDPETMRAFKPLRYGWFPLPRREPQTWSSQKRVGGYVVARGLTSHWEVPTLEVV